MLCLVYLYTYLNVIKTQGILQVALDQQGPNGGAGFRPHLFLTAASESKPQPRKCAGRMPWDVQDIEWAGRPGVKRAALWGPEPESPPLRDTLPALRRRKEAAVRAIGRSGRSRPRAPGGELHHQLGGPAKSNRKLPSHPCSLQPRRGARGHSLQRAFRRCYINKTSIDSSLGLA